MRDVKSKLKKAKALVSRKWRQARFVVGATLGVAVSRLSGNRFLARTFSFLGFAVKKKEVRGEEVELLEIDASRRAFLKYAAFGGAVLVVGKYIDPVVNMLRGDTVLSEKTFQNFKITETGRQLLVTDDDGEEILTIDKESF